VEVSIETASIDTREAKRDAHLKSPDSSTRQVPRLTFKSTKIEKAARQVQGHRGSHHAWRDQVRGARGRGTVGIHQRSVWRTVRGVMATGKLDRKDWGMIWNKALDSGGMVVSDEVKTRHQRRARRAGGDSARGAEKPATPALRSLRLRPPAPRPRLPRPPSPQVESPPRTGCVHLFIVREPSLPPSSSTRAAAPASCLGTPGFFGRRAVRPPTDARTGGPALVAVTRPTAPAARQRDLGHLVPIALRVLQRRSDNAPLPELTALVAERLQAALAWRQRLAWTAMPGACSW